MNSKVESNIQDATPHVAGLAGRERNYIPFKKGVTGMMKNENALDSGRKNL